MEDFFVWMKHSCHESDSLVLRGLGVRVVCVEHLLWTPPSRSCRRLRCCSRAWLRGTFGCSSWSATQSSHSALSQAEQNSSATWWPGGKDEGYRRDVDRRQSA